MAIHRCPTCGYSLRGLPPVHACPECGLPYSRHGVVFFYSAGGFALAIATCVAILLPVLDGIYSGWSGTHIALIAFLLVAILGVWKWESSRHARYVCVTPTHIRLVDGRRVVAEYNISDVQSVRFDWGTGEVTIAGGEGRCLGTIKRDFLGSGRALRRAAKYMATKVGATGSPQGAVNGG
jgi:hypothetical protein